MSVMEDPFANASDKGGRRAHPASIELAALAGVHDDILLLAADLGTGPLGAAFIAKHPDKFVEFGIAEANSMSAGAGLAACGFRPYVMGMSCFSLLKCAEQIRNDIAYPNLPVRILASLPGLALGYFGTSHHAVEDIAFARSITNLTLVAPSCPASTRALLRLTVDAPGPVAFRLTTGSEPPLYDDVPALTMGRFPTLRDGGDLTMIGTGIGTQVAVGAAKLLAEEGIEARVLDALFLKPFDDAAVLAAARETGRILTVEEHNVVGGLGTATAEVLARNGVSVPLSIHGLPDADLKVATPPVLYQHYGLTPEGVAAKARALVSG